LGIRRVLPVGKAFSVYKVRTAWAEEEIDVALARSERSTGPGHREFDIRTKDVDAWEDAARRDFTINSLLFALRTEKGRLTGAVVDFFGGLEDLQRKLIRGVGRTEDRFREDPLRMLRAIRQKNERRGYAIGKETWAAIRLVAPEFLRTIPGERIIGELLRSLLANPAASVKDLRRTGILRILLPEVFAVREGLARILPRYAILERSLGRPLPEIPLLANLLVDIAEQECRARIRRAFPKVRRGRKRVLAKEDEIKLFRLPRTDAIARRLHFPQVRGVVRILGDLNRLAHSHRMRNRNARIEAIFGRWDSPAALSALYKAVNRAAARKGVDFRPLLKIAALRPPLLSGRDLLRLGIPASPRVEAILEEVREGTLSGRVRTREEAVNLALSVIPSSRRAGKPAGSLTGRQREGGTKKTPPDAG
jgi:tRNA nucleotidyltransferase/poly(A) polymerase